MPPTLYNVHGYSLVTLWCSNTGIPTEESNQKHHTTHCHPMGGNVSTSPRHGWHIVLGSLDFYISVTSHHSQVSTTHHSICLFQIIFFISIDSTTNPTMPSGGHTGSKTDQLWQGINIVMSRTRSHITILSRKLAMA